jgi:hypothetical protein
MPGFDPGIHVLPPAPSCRNTWFDPAAWMAGTSPAMTCFEGEIIQPLSDEHLVSFSVPTVMRRRAAARFVEIPHQHRVLAQRRREFGSAIRRMPREDKLDAHRPTADRGSLRAVALSRPQQLAEGACHRYRW